MKNYYSKPLGDISLESELLAAENASRLQRQNNAIKFLDDFAQRQRCVLCLQPHEQADIFQHRGTAYLCCNHCQHIQTQVEPPAGYPFTFADETGFSHVYQQIQTEAYLSRVERVYQPKLDWIIAVLQQELGFSKPTIQSSVWLDMGCGAGYFLKALKGYGVQQFSGYDADPQLVEIGQQFVGEKEVIFWQESLALIPRKLTAKIFTSFFVFEHLSDLYAMKDSLAQLPSGTIVCFAVPCYGLAAILESSATGMFARSLDSVLHTQMFTDKSIDFLINESGFSIISTWYFGQDASDLVRMLGLTIEQNLNGDLKQLSLQKLAKLLDQIQAAIDTEHFCDARHIIMIKK